MMNTMRFSRLQRGALAVRQGRQVRLRGGDALQRLQPCLLQHAGPRDRVADGLGLLRRPHRAQVQPRELRIALPREDERQRHGPVQEVGPAVLAGALGGARDVQDVVQELEGQPDPAPEVAERVRLAAALEAVPSA